MNIEESLQTWIRQTLSQKQMFLGNLPPCPYAAEALMSGQISLREVSFENAFHEVNTTLEAYYLQPAKVHVLAVKDWQSLSVQQVQDFVSRCRDHFHKQDLWLLYDHPQLAEVVNDFSFNHGSLLLFIVQRLSELVESGRELQKSGYYKKWPTDYFEDVVAVREKYYENYLAGQMAHVQE